MFRTPFCLLARTVRQPEKLGSKRGAPADGLLSHPRIRQKSLIFRQALYDARMTKKIAPDMTGKAKDITDLNLLYARVGYRDYLVWSKANPGKGQKVWSRQEIDDLKKLYDGYNRKEMRRARELRKAARVAKAA